MIQKILFGDIEIINTKTKQKELVKGLVFKENDKPSDNSLVRYVLKHKPKPDRKHYKILRLCRERAKVVGLTNP